MAAKRLSKSGKATWNLWIPLAGAAAERVLFGEAPPQLPAVSQGRARCHPAWYGDKRPSCVTKQGATTPPSSAPWGHRSLQLAEEAQQRPVEVPRLVQVAGMASARQHDHTVPGEVPEALQGLVAQAGVTVTVQDQGGRLKKRGERQDVREGDANPYPLPQEAAGLQKAEGGQSPAPPEPGAQLPISTHRTPILRDLSHLTWTCWYCPTA